MNIKETEKILKECSKYIEEGKYEKASSMLKDTLPEVITNLIFTKVIKDVGTCIGEIIMAAGVKEGKEIINSVEAGNCRANILIEVLNYFLQEKIDYSTYNIIDDIKENLKYATETCVSKFTLNEITFKKLLDMLFKCNDTELWNSLYPEVINNLVKSHDTIKYNLLDDEIMISFSEENKINDLLDIIYSVKDMSKKIIMLGQCAVQLYAVNKHEESLKLLRQIKAYDEQAFNILSNILEILKNEENTDFIEVKDNILFIINNININHDSISFIDWVVEVLINCERVELALEIVRAYRYEDRRSRMLIRICDYYIENNFFEKALVLSEECINDFYKSDFLSGVFSKYLKKEEIDKAVDIAIKVENFYIKLDLIEELFTKLKDKGDITKAKSFLERITLEDEDVKECSKKIFNEIFM